MTLEERLRSEAAWQEAWGESVAEILKEAADKIKELEVERAKYKQAYVNEGWTKHVRGRSD